MSRLKREGNPPSNQLASPVPQAWDPSINDFREITGQNLGGGRFGADGVQWGKTASGLFVPVRVTNDGVQEVQLSGTIVSTPALGPMEVAAGARVLVFEDDSGLFSKAMFLIYVTAGSASGKLYERYSVGPHTSVALESELPLINRNVRLFTEQPHPLLSPHRVRIYWENTTTNTQTISRFATWFYGR